MQTYAERRNKQKVWEKLDLKERKNIKKYKYKQQENYSHNWINFCIGVIVEEFWVIFWSDLVFCGEDLSSSPWSIYRYTIFVSDQKN